MENSIPFRQFFLFCGVPWIPVVDIGSPGHGGEAKADCFDLRAKNLSGVKRDGMA
jgi:hypothetical protein